jgi:hypothetical protein
MTTTAIAEGFHVGQAYLGAKIHDAKDPGADLSAMLMQVVGSVFDLMKTYFAVWNKVQESQATPVFGFPFEVGLEPVPINLARMVGAFAQGCRDLKPIYEKLVSSATMEELSRAATLPPEQFLLRDETWITVVYDFAIAHHRQVLNRDHLLKSLTPLYLGWVASFARQTEQENAMQVEDRIEKLCVVYEVLKPSLIAHWDSQKR